MKKLLGIIGLSVALLSGCGEPEDPNQNENNNSSNQNTIIDSNTDVDTNPDQSSNNCPPGFTGENCDQCADKHFTGPNCDQCSDKFTGVNCDKCADSKFTGTNCDQCTNRRFAGVNCDQCSSRFTGENCDQCADSKFTGTNCDQCVDNRFTGFNCDKCADSRFTGKNCDQCANSKFTGTNCDQCADSRFTGENCDQCADSRFTGRHCDICVDSRFYGPNCDQCTNSRFTGENCDQCADNRFTGVNCDKCADSRFTGYNCDQCADNRFTGANCDQCTNSRFTGENCDQCASGYYGENCDSFKPSDGNTYKTVVINSQIWMAENLRNQNVEHYSANNDSANDKKYGYLYTWEKAIKACPSGWRLPTAEEYLDLIGATEYEQNMYSSSIRDLSWAKGSNSTGFSALPAGARRINGVIDNFDSAAYFWASTPYGLDQLYFMGLDYHIANVNDITGIDNFAFSVRCIQNNCKEGFTGPKCKKITCVNGTLNTETGTCLECNEGYYSENCDKKYGSVTTSDGNTYKTIVINNQTWMEENLRNPDVEHYSANNNSTNDAKYGYLYTWDNAMKACPSGWRLPTAEEYLDFIGTTEYEQNMYSSSIRDLSWAKGSNTSGFSALPAGARRRNGVISNFDSGAYFWASTPYTSDQAYFLDVDFSVTSVKTDSVDYAFSVRCVMD